MSKNVFSFLVLYFIGVFFFVFPSEFMEVLIYRVFLVMNRSEVSHGIQGSGSSIAVTWSLVYVPAPFVMMHCEKQQKFCLSRVFHYQLRYEWRSGTKSVYQRRCLKANELPLSTKVCLIDKRPSLTIFPVDSELILAWLVVGRLSKGHTTSFGI